MPNKQTVTQAAAATEATVNARIQETILQALRYTDGEALDAVSVDSSDPQRLNIRLGEGLGFIKRIVLSDDRVVHNMHYSAASVTPSEIIALFSCFGACPPEN